MCTTNVSNQRQRQLVSLASSCVLRVCCIIYVVIYTFIMEVARSQWKSVPLTSCSWECKGYKKKKKLTKPDTKNSIYKHPKRRRRSRRRQGTAAQSFANESTIFYCHCWALNAKHKHAHKHTQIKETNNLDHLFAFTCALYLCSCACCLISIYLYNFNLSALRGRTPQKKVNQNL